MGLSWWLRGQAFTDSVKSHVETGAMINCADNTRAKNLYIISEGDQGTLNRLPAAGVGDMVMLTFKKSKPELRKKVCPAVVM